MLLASFLSGCSGMAQFIVENDSTLPITVKWSDWPKNSNFTPRVGDARAIRKASYNTSALPPAAFDFDADKKEYSAIVPAGGSVVISETMDIVAMDDFSLKYFKDSRFEVASQNGSTIYAGTDIFRAFKRVRRTMYVLTYK